MNRILHADDHEDQRALVREVLESEGYQVTDAEDGSRRIEQLTQADFTAIILDLSMPRVRGDMVIQWVLANRPHLASRIVITTGDPSSASRSVVLSRLSIPLLAKPYGIVDLLLVVERIVAASIQTQAPGQD